MFEVVRYNVRLKAAWNQFVSNSRNGTFLFYRDYMDYHSDRFEDYSLMIYRKGNLCALYPANKVDNILYSHQGLTYGGLLFSFKISAEDVLLIFQYINSFLKDQGIVKVIYKAMPWIYHICPAEEDLYALFRLRAKLIGRNLSSTICRSHVLKFTESRKSGLRKAIKNNIIVKESDDFDSFWHILSDNLNQKYSTSPVHSIDEIKLLHERFPDEIKLFVALLGQNIIAGTVIYVTRQVIHTQYISANPIGKELGALDLLFDHLINHEFQSYPYFDFGQSTENNGSFLNQSLIFQKEGFGGRGVVYDIYEYDL
ncbi:GNAT family N-acetyltransferase [Parabacteroides sp.]